MSTFKEIYDILKALKEVAKRLRSQEMISLSLDVQEKLFELKEEIENVKEENDSLKKKLEAIEHPEIDKDDINFTQNGFLTLDSERNKLPYCSACWKLEQKLVPLAKGTKAWYHYTCPHCKAEFSIMDACGNDLLAKGIKK